MMDWRKILVAYMKNVVFYEGVTFVYGDLGELTEEENKALQQVDRILYEAERAVHSDGGEDRA